MKKLFYLSLILVAFSAHSLGAFCGHRDPVERARCKEDRKQFLGDVKNLLIEVIDKLQNQPEKSDSQPKIWECKADELIMAGKFVAYDGDLNKAQEKVLAECGKSHQGTTSCRLTKCTPMEQ
jgi:hypothetical protein